MEWWFIRRLPLFVLLVIPAALVSVLSKPHLRSDVVPLAFKWIHGFCWGHDWKPYLPTWPELEHCETCDGVRPHKR